MASMQGVPSALIARNESWVRQQAQRLVRRLPGNVEKADLIQVGLIAVAQTAVSFVWEGDRDSEEARAAFVRYAQARVKGAMLDELRQMDTLSRVQRRQIKVIEIASERWRAAHGSEPGLAQLSRLCQLEIDEIASLQALAAASRSGTAAQGDDDPDAAGLPTPATERDEVEARVDTAIVFRRLEAFFAQLPERERTVIDAYLGVGLTLADAAKALRVSPSRISQIYAEVVKKAGRALGVRHDHRAVDRLPGGATSALRDMVAERERELGASSPDGHNNWGERLQRVLASEPLPAAEAGEHDRIEVGPGTRWG